MRQTLLQICYAIAIGYLFTIIFIKTKSLFPCIITHGVLNALSVFAAESTLGQDVVSSVILIIISLGYAAYLQKDRKKNGIAQYGRILKNAAILKRDNDVKSREYSNYMPVL
jgi:hypothetical protein